VNDVNKKKPHYIMPAHPDATDKVIERKFEQFNALAERKGLDAARMEAINQLAGIALWLGEVHGSRRTYEFFAQVTDGLIAPELARD
jgi:hypothetical protein